MFAVTNGKLMTITQGTIDKGTILIDDGRIVDLGKGVEIPPDAEVFDAKGKVVMPGQR